ncbi:tetratricopeptide repeat protein [Streptomyces sp. NPDC088788]|uniref:tetratricopeptide repeat protein n=1 Tax=Streptomyces sp. NPDC088788 TaxID=3365898 RepID=UPI003802DF77
MGAQPSMQELIEERRRLSFVGRGAERAAFLRNFDVPVRDPGRRFLFHVHGNAGVGKTFLVRELEQLAREAGALTAYVDESTGSVPEAMETVCAGFARQGRRLKELERLLERYRERRHEADSLTREAAPGEPSAAGTALARAGLVGLGMVPGVGPFAGAVDPGQLAGAADRMRAGLSAHFRSRDDVRLVMSPEEVLTPVLLEELARAAGRFPRQVLFFDTYERTGLFLDAWLHATMALERHGVMPGNVVVVTAGRSPLDLDRWGGCSDSVAEMPLLPFTEQEAREVLAGRGVVAEPVVEEILRLTGRLPVLVSTLAETRPADPDDVGDPSATAVDSFLKWEHDPVHRSVALGCAFPRRLDADVFRAAAERPEEEADALYDWLRGLPFVTERGGGIQYHDVVRAPMLRSQRLRSPRGWTGRHGRLAESFGRWREEAAEGLVVPDEVWRHEPWRRLRLEESYHRLCARPRSASGDALRDVVEACRADRTTGRTWARMIEEAGEAAGDPAVRDLGRDLADALDDGDDGVTRAMNLLLASPALQGPGRALAHGVRARELRNAGEYERALAEYDRAVDIDPDEARVHYGRGVTHQLLGDHPAALAAFDRADELRPGTGWIIAGRAETLRLAARFGEAVADFDRAVALDPTDADALASRAVCRHALEQFDAAAADFERALSIDGTDLWTLVRRARLRRDTDEWDLAFTDLDRAAGLAPDSAWVASERGDAYRLAGRFEDAVGELGRAIGLEPGYASALAGRGASHHELGDSERALADLDRAVALVPEYSWALVMRARVRRRLDDVPGANEDLRRALAASPEADWIEIELGNAHWTDGRYQEAIAVFRRVLERDPENASALGCLGAIHRDLKEYAEALSLLDRALTADPDYAYAYDQRARVLLATGRTERALADWERRIALGGEVDAAHYEVMETLVHCGRRDEAMARLSEVDPAPDPDDELVLDRDLMRVEAFRYGGEWARARRLAERLRAEDPAPGTFQVAMTELRSRGPEAAEPWWRELAGLLDTEELDETTRLQGRCIVGWGLGDWAAADRSLTEVLALNPDWDDLAVLADIVDELLLAPATDHARLRRCLATVTAARDAVRARWTD